MNNKVSRILVLTVCVMVLGATSAVGQVIYDSTTSPLPGNLPSVGAEAYAFVELGDQVTFGGTARRLSTVTVTMSSFGCQSGNWFAGTCVSASGATFSVPITLKIYNVGIFPNAGSVIATKTQTFSIPYRPSADNINCTGGRWFSASEGTCYNGLAANITFDLTSLNVTLPNNAIYGVSYNTTNYGPAPIGPTACSVTAEGCPYDSLNIALGSVVSTGTKPFFNTLFQNSPFGGQYCDGGLAGTGTFRLDSPTSACWFDTTQSYIPAAKFSAFTVVTNKDQCKNNGWQSLSRADGSSFKNQGDCIQYANTGK